MKILGHNGVMRAIVRGEHGVVLEHAAAPAGAVVIDVAFAGVCRTDLAVVDGTIAVPAGRILGHELSGRVRSGAGFVEGEPVTVIPFVACGACGCARGERCASPAWLGVDRDGAFADRVGVPASCVLRLPPKLSLRDGAYVEPVAAALGALEAVRGAVGQVLVSGHGRIAELTARVLAAGGHAVARHAPGDVMPAAMFGAAIEHGGDVSDLIAALRPGGTLVLKSRNRRSLELPAGELVARDLVVRGASHGSFAAAIDWLHARRIAIADLVAPARPLEELGAVFAAARHDERHKQMFAVAPHLERP